MFFNEVHSMWQNGAEIEVIECDAAVQKIYDYKGKFPKFPVPAVVPVQVISAPES